MPSARPLPTIRELLGGFAAGVVGQKEQRADVHRGSGYDLLGGVGAMLYSREARRDRDLFRACYFDSAGGDDLTTLGIRSRGIARIQVSAGMGFATIQRPTATGGVGTLWTGTRIVATSLTGTSDARVYAVASDTPIAATSRTATVPVRATVDGPGTSIDSSAAPCILRFDDPLWDATWTVSLLTCAEGAALEPPEVYRARVRQTRRDARRGYLTAITNACIAAGAVNVLAYASNYAGDANDYGLNVVYVSDAGYATSLALINNCIVALESARVLGADMQVLPMQTAPLTIAATVSLWDNPGVFALPEVTAALTTAATAFFSGQGNAYAFRLDALAGDMSAAHPAVQAVTFTQPTGDMTVAAGTPPTFPAVLTRYTLSPQAVSFTFTGPA